MGGRQRRLWLARALSLVVVLQILLIPAPAQALGWHLPGRAAPLPGGPGPAAGPQRLQEVAPPEWTQRLQNALDERDPQVEILSPVDGSVLPDGPWTLRLQVSDWPLVDAGPLGLGPHLVVQLDGQPPLPVVETEVRMPPLAPGSHRLSVYAAKPWGEAHKSPAALRQIRLHRLAPNPATLPLPGTPQLLPVGPVGPAGAPPLLLDWLLIDAPLQGLRTDSPGWRLRVTVNGESVLLDRQTPLWLKGWKPGSNALLLELLDGRGDPLNPPFNSLLQEVIVPAPGAVPQPRSAPLTPLEMAVLLGQEPAAALLPAAPDPVVTDPEPQEEPEVGQEPTPPPAPPAMNPIAAPGGPDPPSSGPLRATPEPSPEPLSLPEPPSPPAPSPVAPVAPSVPQAPSLSAVDPDPDPVPAPSPSPAPIPSARDEVNPDGTLRRPPPSSPLDRLRQRLNR